MQTPLPPTAPPSPEAVIINAGGPNPLEYLSICVVAVCAAFVAYKILMPLVRAYASRIEGKGSSAVLEQRVNDLQQQLADTDVLQSRVAELEERLDFAERLLAQRDEAARLPTPGDRH